MDFLKMNSIQSGAGLPSAPKAPASLQLERQLVPKAPVSPQPEWQPAPEKHDPPPIVYADRPEGLDIEVLQQNMQTCLIVVDSEVRKNYLPSLRDCPVVELDQSRVEELDEMQFFRITELVYQEDEFSVHKLATVFHALSNKPCTLALMIRSSKQATEFYLGVRSLDKRNDTGTMRILLEDSLRGLFPGSHTGEYLNEQMRMDLEELQIGCVSSVSCIADYRQEKDARGNKEFFQGLEKLIYGMQDRPFTAIFLANNLTHSDLVWTRLEYEQIYTALSPFASMQYNFGQNDSFAASDSRTQGVNAGRTKGENKNNSETQTKTDTHTIGENKTYTKTDTQGTNVSETDGNTHTESSTEGISDTEGVTKTKGSNIGLGSTTSVNAGLNAGVNLGCKFIGASLSALVGAAQSLGLNVGFSHSVARSNSHGTSHSDSVSDSVSRNKTTGSSRTEGSGESNGTTKSDAHAESQGKTTSVGESTSESISYNNSYTQALTDTLGQSQGVTLNIQNRVLTDTLQRLEKQLGRLDECESIGMWDFAAYFLGESAAEAETAASLYRSLISGNRSGLEAAAVNTWTEPKPVHSISAYVTNFLHPVFRLESGKARPMLVDPTVLTNTNELAIQLGLPRKSVKGLPVIEHAAFAQEVLNYSGQSRPDAASSSAIRLGKINHFGKATDTEVTLDLQSLSMHTFVTGSTGSGKSNTVYQILSELAKKGVNFLVVEPAKGEYKNVFGHQPDVHILGTNPQFTELLQINPFRFPKGIHVLEHIDRLVEIFNVCWPMYAAMPAVLKDAILQAYQVCGWNLSSSVNPYSEELFPTFSDLLSELIDVIQRSAYSEEVKSNYIGSLATRIRSLTNGLNGQIFASHETDNRLLFDRKVIVDISRVGSAETKSLIMGILIMRLSEHRMSFCTEMNASLRHVTVLEEAHNILRRTSTEQSEEGSNVAGKSVEMISNAIAEMRTYGEGFIIVDQSPSAVDISAIRNTNTKIIMRLPDEQDRRLAGKSAGLRDDQLDEIAKLQKGVAVVYQNDWIEPVLCGIEKFQGAERLYRKPAASAPNAPDKAFILAQALLNKCTGEALGMNLQELSAIVVGTDLPSRRKLQALNALRANGVCAISAVSPVIYDLLCPPAVEAEAEEAESIEEWRNVFLYNSNSPLTDMSETAQNMAMECILREQIERYGRTEEYLQLWEQFLKGELV